MEDILDVYTEKYDENCILVCMDEVPRQLINVLVNYGLSKRVPSMQQMKKEVTAWNKARNQNASKINWRFSTENARIKLKRLYPQFE